ncbi:hypothetical protein ACI65C_008967 [Semiaphis heraclei]
MIDVSLISQVYCVLVGKYLKIVRLRNLRPNKALLTNPRVHAVRHRRRSRRQRLWTSRGTRRHCPSSTPSRAPVYLHRHHPPVPSPDDDDPTGPGSRAQMKPSSGAPLQSSCPPSPSTAVSGSIVDRDRLGKHYIAVVQKHGES